ncbi:SAM-dependent methyltransferase [uncultured Amnibacterium sp.]|uniref:THUMP-like domain-containing protein n=1 Tax=uncultured Amnibacterium sp. TaxID=1631851 RepID=UPI0035CAB8A5
MDAHDLEVLLTPEVLAAIDAEPEPQATSDVLARSTALRRAGFSPEASATILTQSRLRRRARAKFGPFAARMLFTQAGLEQATRLNVAAHHAQRMRAAGVERVADLGCGIGGDAMAFAAIDLDVLAVERDAVTAALAAYNLQPFPGADVRIGDAAEADLTGVGAVWLDPARRTDGHDDTRRVGADTYSPSIAFALETAARLPTGVKLSPAYDRDEIPADAEAQWVSSGPDTVELALWFGDLRRSGVRRSALVVTPEGSAELAAGDDTPDEPTGPLARFVHEPAGAVIRARLIGELARRTGTHPVGDGIAYLTGDEPLVSPFLTSFEVDAVLPFDRLRIRKELRERGIGRLEIKKRGVDLDPATFRTFLGLRGDGDATLIVTRTEERRVAVVCHRAAA